MTPQRIQRKRTKGWRMPENTVYVGRPSVFGNPFPAGECDSDRLGAVEAFRSLLTERPTLLRHQVLKVLRGNNERGEMAVARMRARLPELRGKNLACWCPLDQPCHADVLIELANDIK